MYHTGFAQQLPSPRRLGYMLLALLALFTASSTSEYVDLGSGLGCNTSAEVALASTRLYLYTQLPEVAGRLEPCSTREPRHIRYGSTLCHGCKVHPSPGHEAGMRLLDVLDLGAIVGSCRGGCMRMRTASEVGQAVVKWLGGGRLALRTTVMLLPFRPCTGRLPLNHRGAEQGGRCLRVARAVRRRVPG